MNSQQHKALTQAEKLVRSAGQNILDALAEIKTIKEDQPMQTAIDPAQPGGDHSAKIYHHPNGRVDIVRQHRHGMTVMGNVDPTTMPRWKAKETSQGTTYYTDDAPTDRVPKRRKTFSTPHQRDERRHEQNKARKAYRRDRSWRHEI